MPYVRRVNPRYEDIPGKPIQILSPSVDFFFNLHEKRLEQVLLHNEVRDRYVVVVSVAGDYRKGKSFLLGYFIRYLNCMYGHGQEEPKPRDSLEWMGQRDAPLEGFVWKYGSERQTTGIWVWSKLFLTTLRGGEKVAILLMDTQGTFDHLSTLRQSVTVFAMSSLLSSTTCYNLAQNIQENNLTNLQFFTEYGRLASEAQNNKKPFQNLMFIVRDWQYPFEYPFGLSGGTRLVDDTLKLTTDQGEEHQVVRKHLKSCFVEINGFLLPHPGFKVSNPRFDGRLDDLDIAFKEQLKQLVPAVLALDKLVVKEVGDIKLKVKDLVIYFPMYWKALNKGLPEPKNLFMATSEAHNLTAVSRAKESYQTRIEQNVNLDAHVDPALIHIEHDRVKHQVLREFDAAPKLGGAEMSKKYRDQLEEELDIILNSILRQNQDRLAMRWRTPALFLGLGVSTYLLVGILERLVRDQLWLWSDIAGSVAFLFFVTWMYALYRGLIGL